MAFFMCTFANASSEGRKASKKAPVEKLHGNGVFLKYMQFLLYTTFGSRAGSGINARNQVEKNCVGKNAEARKMQFLMFSFFMHSMHNFV